EAARPPEVSSGPTTWPGWLLVGIGAAAGGTALYLQVGEAVPLANKANRLSPDPAFDAEYDRLIGEAKDYQTAALITGITGGVIAATGVILLVTADSDEPPASGAFAPTFGLSPAGAYVGGTLSF
ncbi:MAG TPA: hypothetical protein PK095_24125, partial [Myxococcota bacterium]|nr:hypothetical protein [Myxococcota bacterium]